MSTCEESRIKTDVSHNNVDPPQYAGYEEGYAMDRAVIRLPHVAVKNVILLPRFNRCDQVALQGKRQGFALPMHGSWH